MYEKPDASFIAAIEPFRAAIRIHCYRMLGSSHDGDDIVQETMLRAWRARESLENHEMLRPWLYRIATNACLDELKRRPRRWLSPDAYPPTDDPAGPIAPAIEEPIWLEPMPDTWLECELGPTHPEARYTLKESVALAFVATLQVLPPTQRAMLLLRDVVGFSADEAARALGMTLGAANSALFRARTAVEEKLGGRDRSTLASAALSEVQQEVLVKYVRALEENDVDALIALLHADVITAMPPSPTWLLGLAANEIFFRTMFAQHLPRTGPVVRTSGANGQPAFAFYRAPSSDAPYELRAIQVLDLRDGVIVRVDHFMMPAVFPLFGLAGELPR